MATVLFLDFDGVLHPTRAHSPEFFCQSSVLEVALESNPCELVISSSWRHHQDLTQVVRSLPKFLGLRVVGATGDPFIGKYPRFNEIQKSLLKEKADIFVHD